MATTPPVVDKAGAQKKQYEAPRLQVYGDIGQITQTLGKIGRSDGGHGAHGKTG